jgi:galactonate dehydratase
MMQAMKIERVRAIPIKLPRDLASDTGTAGCPARLVGQKPYRPAEHYDTIYSTQIETTLVRVETEVGLVGWGEAQSPVAPEVTATIIEALLGPLIAGHDALAPEQLWHQMYSAMRVRGHGGGFYLDAIAGIDIAIWDLCGKAIGQPVCRLLGGPCRTEIPYYISGLAGATQADRIAYVSRFADQGHHDFKLFVDASPEDCLATIDGLLGALGGRANFYVDALWRLKPKQALRFANELAARSVGWLEAPLAPEDVAGHARLAEHAELPIAIGESYRTRFELLPFFEQRALDIVQPDLGRVGLTEGQKIAALAETFHVAVAPHVSIGLGPQIAAALHFAAACPNLLVLECNPKIYEAANRFLKNPLSIAPTSLKIPEGPGLGIELRLDDLGTLS